MFVSKNMRQNDGEVTVRKGRMSKEICVKCQGIIRGGILSEMIASHFLVLDCNNYFTKKPRAQRSFMTSIYGHIYCHSHIS